MLIWFINLPTQSQLLIVFLLVINIITFFYFGLDKMRAQINQTRRISEKTLWLLSLIGGSIGALLGIKYFRHKSKKLSFQAGMAIILALQILVIYFLIYV